MIFQSCFMFLYACNCPAVSQHLDENAFMSIYGKAKSEQKQENKLLKA